MKSSDLLEPCAALAAAVILLACGAESPGPSSPPGDAGAAGVATASRVESCSIIDRGAAAVSARASQEMGAATGGSPTRPYCAEYFSECTDADVAAMAPQYACFSEHGEGSTAEIRSSCTSSAPLSDACNRSLSTRAAATKAWPDPFTCWQSCTTVDCFFNCTFFWWY